ncbi:MAG: hypothetical protein LUH02_07190 [Erysipelotrichaceae bacterium]|nr:hypothetical protein [Erysipelotrichaceae bacterium]
MNELFIQAAQKKYRFPYKGQITVEDLFDLNMEQLNTIFQSLNKEVKDADTVSLLEVKSDEDKDLENKIEIVKYVFNVKLAQKEAISKQKEIADEKQKIMAIIEDKENAALKDLTVEELKAKLDELK